MTLRKSVLNDPFFAQDFEHAGRDWVPALKVCGVCHYCERPVAPDRLFCRVACKDAFNEFERRLLRAD